MSITSISRDWGFAPSIVRITSTNTLAEVGTTDYLTAQADNIAAVNSGAFEWDISDFVLVYASDGWDLFSIDPTFASLNVWEPGTGVAIVGAPVVAGNLPKFNGTAGNIEDSGIAAADVLSSALANGHIFVGSAGGVATDVAMSGDATIIASGALTIANSAITNAKVAAAAAIDYSKLAALTSGHILVGSVGNVATSVVMSGDATIIASGALTIANNAITTVKILDANVTLAKLAAGITPSHIVKFAGQPTTVGGGAAEAITVTGAAATDLAFVQIVDNGTNNVTVISAVVTLNTLTVTFSGDPGNDAIINYQLLRAAA